MSKPKYLYAIGDVHGMAPQLAELLGKIRDHAEDIGREFHLVFLGDLVDRGAYSYDVVQTVKELCEVGVATCIMGNHEWLMLFACSDPSNKDAVQNWAMNGGDETLKAYSAAQAKLGKDPMNEHLVWMAQLPLTYETEHYVFVHAGFSPGGKPSQSSEDAMLWIREPFLSQDWDFGKHVVHGHSPNPYGVVKRKFRTGVDIGSFYSGKLAAVVIDPEKPGGPVHEIVVEGDPAPRWRR